MACALAGVVLRADRPFVYAIYDRETRAILFLGRLMNPSPSADPANQSP